MKKIKYIWAITLVIVGLMITSAAGLPLDNSTEIQTEETRGMINISELENNNGQSTLVEEELKYYEGVSPSNVWGGGSSLMELAIRFTPDELGVVDGCSLFRVIFYHGYGQGETGEPHTGTVVIYDGGSDSGPGEVLTTEDFDTGEVYDWIYIDLSSPVTINGSKDIWVSVQILDTGNHCFGLGSAPGVDKKSMWLKSGSSWIQLTDVNPDYSFDWFIGAFVQGQSSGTELKITDPTGPTGINTGVKNIGENPALNVTYSLTVTGGILDRVNISVPDTVTTLAAGAEEDISSGIFFGFGSIDIVVTANADNADKVTTTKSGFLLGFLVIRIK